MALLTVSGEPGSRFEAVAHGAAQLLGFELVTEVRLAQWLNEEFGEAALRPRAWSAAATSILARMAAEHQLVIAAWGSETLFAPMAGLLRAGVVAPPARRVGNLMLDQRLDGPAAKSALSKLDQDARAVRRARLGRSTVAAELFDLILNAEQLDVPQMAEILRAAAVSQDLTQRRMLNPAALSAIEFQTRMQLARYGVVPARRAHLKCSGFSHPSEELFANLLDFYRIQWQYEPRSFPLQWDKDGNVTEAFTPDFYLTEADLYVELTTMKQALVTRKNRKVKMLRAIYPHINIQVFYQKDFQDLVMKYGLGADAAS